MRLWHQIFLKHPYSTDNPQSYWEHGMFSTGSSSSGIKYMLAGIIHGIFPCLFPFTTSSWIIRTFVELVISNRHPEELQQYLSPNFLDELRKQIKK